MCWSCTCLSHDHKHHMIIFEYSISAQIYSKKRISIISYQTLQHVEENTIFPPSCSYLSGHYIGRHRANFSKNFPIESRKKMYSQRWQNWNHPGNILNIQIAKILLGQIFPTVPLLTVLLESYCLVSVLKLMPNSSQLMPNSSQLIQLWTGRSHLHTHRFQGESNLFLRKTALFTQEEYLNALQSQYSLG